VNFFFDRCVPRRLAWMLDAFDPDNTVGHQDDDARFPPETPDERLISALAQDSSTPVLVTSDRAMRRNPVERLALAGSGLTVVFLRSGWHRLRFHDQAVKLLRLWPEIVHAVARVREPTVFEISPAARKVQRIGPTRGLK
jgi:hypothetical protein